MSTKTSSLNMSANNSPTSPAAMNTSTTSASTPTLVKIKKELPSDEIKEFAESTMNELLGWYGFDSVDRLDISSKTSKILQSAALINSQQQQQHQHQMERRRSRNCRANALLQMQQSEQHLHAAGNSNNNNNAMLNNNNSGCSSNNNNNSVMRKNSISSSNYRGNDSTTSDHDTRSSRDDDSKSPNSTGKMQVTTTAASAMDENKLDYQNCCWCRRPVPDNAPEFLTTSDGPRYCSESCFAQSRRASFKKAKTCDWCKHVRHAVSYVDFQDGASQLQFCSDKCLNQYKMQIFCKETQAHLDMNPHLKEHGLKEANNVANLITPDLWLRNCRSRSASPASTMSLSPGPNSAASNMGERCASTTLLTPPKLESANNAQQTANSSYKPMISVAPVSKLMSKSPGIMSARQSPKHNRKKKPIRSTAAAEISSNNRADSKTSSCGTASAGMKSKPLMGNLSETSRANLSQTNAPSLTQFAASCVQDLHMNVPPLSPMLESPVSQPTTPHNLPPSAGRVGTSIPSAFFATPPNAAGVQQAPPPVPPPAGYPPRPPFMHNSTGFFPRFLSGFAGLPQPPSVMMPPDLGAFNALVGTPPPVTVMMPYPVIIPLPIPIPVPLPVVDFYKAYLSPEERRKFDDEQKIKKEKENPASLNTAADCSERPPSEVEEPLDFTKTKDMEESPSETSQMTTSTSPSEDSLSTTPKTLHCVISAEDATMRETTESNKLKSSLTTQANDPNDDSTEENNQKLPKLKITRLQTKRTLIQTKESECSRPLRKRKRIIDCDFQKIAAANNKDMNETLDEEIRQQQTTETELNNNKGQTNST